MTTRTRAKKPTAKKAPRKPTPAPAPIATAKPTGLALRERPPFITDTQIRAAYAASLAGVSYTRITGWLRQSDGTVRYALPSGAGLTYNPAAKVPLTAWTPCAHGVRHARPVTTPTDLHHAQTEAARCRDSHSAETTTQVRTLVDALADPAETQPLDVTALRTEHDEPKEHPHG